MTAALRLATRGSPLARIQADDVAARLRARPGAPAVEIVIVETRADRRLDVPIAELGEHGAFVAEVEIAVLEGHADVAVHSAKDLPSGAPAPGLELASVPVRIDARDALCGGSLAGLARDAVVASGSKRRRAQLAAVRPDLRFVELRGNIATRLGRIPEGGAVVVAMAALERLGLSHAADDVLDVAVMLPQVGQGAIALRCRSDDERTRQLVVAIDDEVAHRCLRAERAFLATIGGGCEAPVGAHATPAGRALVLEGLVASEDGTVLVRRRVFGEEPEELGRLLAEEILGVEAARLVVDDLSR